MRKTVKKQHHVYHLKRLGLLSVLLLSFFAIRLDANHSFASFGLTSSSQVLAYATELSRSALLSSTNAARAVNGFGALSANSQLNNSAQAKAQDMMNKDYWAHVAPDGTQPWFFFDQAGYVYSKAGENLAYGFSTSQGTIDGWMNSPTHRANILGDYADVGFGFVNAPNFQSSGEETIVVAHYGTKPGAPVPTPAPTPPPTATTVTPPPAAPTPPKQPSAPTKTTVAPTASTETPAPDAPTDNTPRATDIKTPVTPTVKDTLAKDKQISQPQSEQTITLASRISNNRMPLMGLVGLLVITVVVIGYALTHRVAFHRAVASGENFALTHPGIDASIVIVVVALMLLTTYGHIL